MDEELRLKTLDWVLEKVEKKSGKPFKSTLKINTVKRVVFVKHPNKKYKDLCYTSTYFLRR